MKRGAIAGRFPSVMHARSPANHRSTTVFDLALGREGQTFVVGLAGELDMATAPEFTDCLAQLVEQCGADVVVDLGQLTFCDSAGISALVQGYEAARSRGGRLRIRGENGSVARVLDIAGVRVYLADSSTSRAR